MNLDYVYASVDGRFLGDGTINIGPMVTLRARQRNFTGIMNINNDFSVVASCTFDYFGSSIVNLNNATLTIMISCNEGPYEIANVIRTCSHRRLSSVCRCEMMHTFSA